MTEAGDRLEEAVGKFCDFTENLTESAFADQEWGPKEVLAHLVYWHEIYLMQACAAQNLTPVKVPRGRYVDLNNLATERGRKNSMGELVERFRRANQGLLEVYKTCDPAQIVVPVKHGARSYTLAELVPVVESHVRSHHKQLMRDVVE